MRTPSTESRRPFGLYPAVLSFVGIALVLVGVEALVVDTESVPFLPEWVWIAGGFGNLVAAALEVLCRRRARPGGRG